MFNPNSWVALLSDWDVFASGLGHTLLASGLALIIALVVGSIVGVMALAPIRTLRFIARVYVELFQNTPLVMQIFFYYNGLPLLGITLPVLTIGAGGLGIYTGAYIAEIVRAGLQSVPKGQLEAATSQGMSYVEAMWHVVMPQALRLVTPPLTNQMVNLIKNSSVLAMIAGFDLMYQADVWSSATLKYQVAYFTTALLYLCITIPLATLSRRLEANLGTGRGEGQRSARLRPAIQWK